MNKLALLILFGIFLTASSSFGQYVKEEADSTKVEDSDKKEEEKAEKKDKRENPLKKISIGGNFGFWMYSGGGSLLIAPKIGYQLKPWFRPGVSLNYQYSWANYGSTKWSSSAYGGGVFAHFILLKRILLQAEWELLNTLAYPGGTAEPFRMNVNMLFLGVGYNQAIGRSGYVSFSLLYDVINHPYSPYRQQYMFRSGSTPIPVILRIGFGFGF